MLTAQESQNVRELASKSELEFAQEEGQGYIYHGTDKPLRKTVPKNVNLLHFAHCNKIDKLAEGQPRMFWFEKIRVASKHLNEHIGQDRWKWCKQCEAEVTQRLLDQEGY